MKTIKITIRKDSIEFDVDGVKGSLCDSMIQDLEKELANLGLKSRSRDVKRKKVYYEDFSYNR